MKRIMFILLPFIVLFQGLFISSNAQIIGGVVLRPGAQTATVKGTDVQSIGTLDRVPPVPAWPADGNIPEALQKQYVFYEPSTNSYVISYPEKLVDPDGPDQRIPPIRYPLNNAVKPTLSVQISETDGIYKYVYSVQNEVSAKDLINSVSLVVGSESETVPVRLPFWSTGPNIHRANAKQAAMVGAPMGSFLTWFGLPGGEIGPGKTAPDFQITSNFKPGFTSIYFRGPVAPGLNYDIKIPEEVTSKLDKLLTYEGTSYVTLTLGPIFSEDESKVRIAADFYQGISLLGGIRSVPSQPLPQGAKLSTGPLDPDSPFVKEALAKLKEYMGMGASANASQTWTDVKAKPANDLEKQIATALALAMKE